MNEYHSQHPEAYVFVVLQIVFDILGAIPIVANFEKAIRGYLSDTEGIFMLLGVFSWIIGLIFLILTKSCENKAIAAYNNYLQQLNANNQNTSNTTASYDAYIKYSHIFCTKCGTKNNVNNKERR